ncbi:MULTISPECIES: DUF3147 family protein [Bacillus]|uniref:DUF3147 family protein n=1 Tax=Bacillus TaxID=1386 RepID=UPI0001CE34CC|nr:MULTISPECIES: DUF3147 family protein [Bacillus]AMK70987.1 hypothetical protein AWV81_01965 [Bacillus subtilis subsp. natto]AOR96708.1 hypothetical protein BSBS38_00393 [Bacillus subtilis]AOS66523.1 hypothetical protein A4A60_02015 [Bacillus subtilis]API44647.1 hypothetical protein BSR08_20425 [Bacillus subtilis]API96252.1 hypothetical protein BKP58_10365 [Bacillus subtilis]
MAVLSKVIISALIIGFVTEISKRHPTYGGIIAALPLVSLLSLFWMQIQSQFASGVLTGIPATVCLLAILAFLLKIHVPFWFALCVGILGWAMFLWMQKIFLNILFN